MIYEYIESLVARYHPQAAKLRHVPADYRLICSHTVIGNDHSIEVWCPACFDAERDGARIVNPPVYMQARYHNTVSLTPAFYVRSDQFMLGDTVYTGQCDKCRATLWLLPSEQRYAKKEWPRLP